MYILRNKGLHNFVQIDWKKMCLSKKAKKNNQQLSATAHLAAAWKKRKLCYHLKLRK